MKLNKRDPNDPEVVERVLARIRQMSPEEALKMLGHRSEGIEETWMVKSMRNGNPPATKLNDEDTDKK